MNSALKGIRVVDLTWMLAGPYATRILGDCGAEVIKVQSNLTSSGMERNESPLFRFLNRNKRSITLNLSAPQGRDILRELIKISDLMVCNFSPRVLKNWGLEYKSLRKENRKIILASLSAFGASGPWQNYVALAGTLEALSGITAETSFIKPDVIPFPYADMVAALYLATACLSALEKRRRTGRGCFIDLSAFEALCSMLGPYIITASGKTSIYHDINRGAEECRKQFKRYNSGNSSLNINYYSSLSCSPPFKFSKTATCREKAPMLGEDNDYVFGTLLGLSTAQIAEYRQKGIIY